MNLLRIAVCAARLCVGSACVLIAGQAQEVIKPTTTTVQIRLPAPSSVSARQLPDGRIEVRWTPVSGAVRYQLTRSVPPTGAQVIQPDPVAAEYFDSDIRVGSTHYYLIAAYGGDGTLGLKAGSNPVTATIPLGGATAPQLQGVTAQLVAANRARVAWGAMPGSSSQVIVSRVVAANSTDVARLPLGAGSFEDTFSLPAGTQFAYRVRIDGQTAAGVLTNSLTAPGDTANTPATASVTASGATLKVSAPVTLRVGTSATISGAGAGVRWLSMNESIASVDAVGNVVGRAAGPAQIVALSMDADGSLRVTSVSVNVVP